VIAERAYVEVERLTRQRARNFAYGIMLLPRPKRRAIAAIYAFARRVDDIADGRLPTEEKRAQLERVRTDLHAVPDEDATLVALADSIARYSIPLGPLEALVDGGLQDTAQTRYADFDDLRVYCSLVAGAVGRACVAVYGADEPEQDETAETLGIALQLINIARDVAEDWRLGRVYLPQDDLRRFGVSEAQIADGRVDDAWRALVEFEVARARRMLEAGRPLTRVLPWRLGLELSAVVSGGLRILDRIDRVGGDVFARRPVLAAGDWIVVAWRALVPASVSAA
jgi:squalene synthase HpnC